MMTACEQVPCVMKGRAHRNPSFEWILYVTALVTQMGRSGVIGLEKNCQGLRKLSLRNHVGVGRLDSKLGSGDFPEAACSGSKCSFNLPRFSFFN